MSWPSTPVQIIGAIVAVILLIVVFQQIILPLLDRVL